MLGCLSPSTLSIWCSRSSAADLRSASALNSASSERRVDSSSSAFCAVSDSLAAISLLESRLLARASMRACSRIVSAVGEEACVEAPENPPKPPPPPPNPPPPPTLPSRACRSHNRQREKQKDPAFRDVIHNH